MFVGREAELEFLESKYRARAGQLVVLYGRRRIGKTETLRQFCKDKPHVFFVCQECSDKLQLKNFSDKMLREDNLTKKTEDEPDDYTPNRSIEGPRRVDGGENMP